MKTVDSQLGKFPEIEIHIFSDWHIGDKNCNYNIISQHIDYIKEHKNAFVILNGDLCNNATKTSVSDNYAEELSPMEQIEKVCDLLTPIKDRIIFASQGNHEARTYRDDGIDITSFICRELGVSDKYCREGGVLFVTFNGGYHHGKQGKILYSFYITHGSGGGRKEGAKAIRLADLANVVDTDIYIHSHTHLPMIMKEGFYRTCTEHKTVNYCEKLFVNTESSLEFGGYGQIKGFKPVSNSTPVIYLAGKKKFATAKL